MQLMPYISLHVTYSIKVNNPHGIQASGCVLVPNSLLRVYHLHLQHQKSLLDCCEQQLNQMCCQSL